MFWSILERYALKPVAGSARYSSVPHENGATKSETTPETPRGLPLLGLTPFLARDRTHFVDRLLRDFGPTVFLEKQPGVGNIMFSSDPAIVDEVLVHRSSKFIKSKHYRKVLPLTGKGSLLLEGESWRTRRKIIGPLFHPSHLNALTKVVAKVVKKYAEREFAPRAGEAFDISKHFNRLTLEVVCEAILGNWATDEEKTKLSQALDQSLSKIEPLFYPKFLSLPGTERRIKKDLEKAAKIIDDISRGIFHRVTLQPHVDNDFVSDFVHGKDGKEGADVESFCSEFKTLVFAGHETTSNALSWMWWCVFHPQNGGVLKSLQAEAAQVPDSPTMADLRKLAVLQNVISETLRIFPSVPSISRDATEDMNIGGWSIKKDDMIVIPIISLHRKGDIWKQPMKFSPHRFEEKARHGNYLPFSKGPRNCVGSGFATMEMLIIVSTLLNQFQFELIPDQHPQEEVHVTMKPSPGIFVRLKNKSSAFH